MQMELLSYCNEIEELSVFMPQKEDIDYEVIINTMLFEIRKQIIFHELEIRQEKVKQKNSNVLRKLNQMQEFILDYKEEQNDKILSDQIIETPKILYTKTPAGNICLLNDLKDISKERYPEFLILFESILKGRLKKPKTIDHSDGKFINSITQIKLDHSRMTFHVMKNNCIALSGAFTKYAQKNSILNNKLKNIDRTFSLQKDYLLEHSEDPVFLSEQEKVTMQVYKVLRKER